jgi:hypothetical protein
MLKPVTLISAAVLLAASIVPAIADKPIESNHMHSMMGHQGKGHGGHHGHMMMDSASPKFGKGKDSFSWGSHAMGHGKGKWDKGHGHGHGQGMEGHPMMHGPSNPPRM